MRDTIDIVLVVSSRKKAPGLLKARRAGIPTEILETPPDWPKLTAVLRSRRVDLIFLLGFMKILPPSFVEEWRGRIANLHPSLLPAYPGLKSIEKCFVDKSTPGVTVHEVTAEMDAGPVLLQRRVGSTGGFDVHRDLAETEFEIHRSEHRLVREVMAKWNREAKLS
jgi:folate-dependent phosphoribosylglycinamide formyltransferase PurN